jgi:hypothetical protein
VEPFSSESAARVRTYGSSVTYKALLQQGAKRVIGNNGAEVVSNLQAMIPDRVHIDQRSRVTLPSGFVPNQPPIVGIRFTKGLGMDCTEILL